MLIISWYFPPIGGPGTQRTSKYCKYLPSNGWSPVVIAGVDPTEHQDETLLADIVTGVEVHRRPLPSTYWRSARRWLFNHRMGRLGSWLGFIKDFPDVRREWAESTVELACGLYAKEPFDLVYTTSHPYSAHIAGEKIKQRLGIPWVADLRDAWSENAVMLGWLPSWVRKRHARAEHRVAQSADALTFAHPHTAQQFQQKYGCTSDRCVGITNGFDPDEYEDFKAMPPIENGMVKLVHTGSFYGDYAPDALRVALEQFWGEAPESPDQLHIRFVGGAGASDFLELPGLKVEVVSRTTQEEALREQEKANVLLMVFDRRLGEAHIPGKLFGYLAAERPIFAVVPSDGATARIIQECNAGWVIDCDDSQFIAEQLKALPQLLSDRQAFQDRPIDLISEYSRRSLTRRLSELFQAVS